jgi:DNA-binding winged helix-turn-helix (wHTH) protein
VQFLFAGYTLDIDRRELSRGSESIAIEPQVFDLLTYLVENRERVVTKDDLIASVWGAGLSRTLLSLAASMPYGKQWATAGRTKS